MQFGEEKLPDNSHEPSDRARNLSLFAFLLVVLTTPMAVAFWLLDTTPPECKVLGQDEIRVTEVDGRKQASLELNRIPTGGCVMIKTNAAPRRPDQVFHER
jgi:hypothetical protein